MLYGELCEYYIRIESASKRLEMTDIFTELFLDIDGKDAEKIIRLTKGEVAPSYEGIELGVAEKMILKALYKVTLIPDEEINDIRNDTGDIGDTAEILIDRKKQQSLFHEDLTIDRIFDRLKRISGSEGRSSQDLKQKIVAELLHDATAAESKYLIRTLGQKMRIGSADMTIIDSLANYTTADFGPIAEEMDFMDPTIQEKLRKHSIIALNDIIPALKKRSKEEGMRSAIQDLLKKIEAAKEKIKDNREKILRAYNIHPDLAMLTDMVINHGIEKIGSIEVSPGVPLRSMLGERLKKIDDILEKLGGRAAFEYKYDGLRIQAHILEDGTVRLFSRQLEDITEQFPDVVENISEHSSEVSSIIEGECVPIDRSSHSMLPFQVISRRRGRKHDLDDTVEEIPVNLVLFDCLLFNDRPMIDHPYLERREKINRIFPKIDGSMENDIGLSLSRMEIIDDPEKGMDFFMTSLEQGSEGIMAKSLSEASIYQAGSRGWNWIKFKKDYREGMSDTLDLVVVGGFHGSGRRGGFFGALLMAVFDEEEGKFRTICKLGSGFNDEHLKSLHERLEGLRITKEAAGQILETRMEPDVFFEPRMVLETMGAEISFSPTHTCGWNLMKEEHGLALRFPRFTGRFRDDKSPHQATSSTEVISMYENQVKRT